MILTTTVDQITDANWQLSNKNYGEVATGEDDILMSVHNILFTRKRELPLDQEAGSDLYKFQDKPLNIAIPGVVNECISSINAQEPRVVVTSVVPNFQGDDGSVIFNLNLKIVGTSQFLGYNLNLGAAKPGGARAFSDAFTNDFS